MEWLHRVMARALSRLSLQNQKLRLLLPSSIWAGRKEWGQSRRGRSNSRAPVSGSSASSFTDTSRKSWLTKLNSTAIISTLPQFSMKAAVISTLTTGQSNNHSIMNLPMWAVLLRRQVVLKSWNWRTSWAWEPRRCSVCRLNQSLRGADTRTSIVISIWAVWTVASRGGGERNKHTDFHTNYSKSSSFCYYWMLSQFYNRRSSLEAPRREPASQQ